MDSKKVFILVFISVFFVGMFLLGHMAKVLTISAEGNSPNPGHTISEIENGDLLATKDYVDEKFRNMSRNFTEGVALKTTGTVPVCDISNTGLLWYLEGESGTQDTIIICQKLQNGDYYYIDLITGEIANWWGSGLSDYGTHNQLDCTSAKGTVVDGENGEKQCKFIKSSCPDGWSVYRDSKGSAFSAQDACTATLTGGQGTSASCSCPGHDFSSVNTGASVKACYSSQGTNPKITKWCCTANCNWDYCYSSRSSSCAGTVTEIGCY